MSSRRRRSPSYEAPRRARRSPSYEPPRDSGSPGRARGHRSPSYEAPRRSPSLEAEKDGEWEEEERGVSPPRGAPVPTYSGRPSLARSRSRSPLAARPMDYPWDDTETLLSLNCKACSVFLHDRDSMMAHLKGAPHLSQQQRLRDKEVRARTGGFGLSNVLKPDNVKMNYDDKFWVQNRGKNRKLKPEQERFLDTKRLDNITAKFDGRNYDHGQFKFDMKENYCEKCDVWTKTRDQMQAHREGANHRKMSAKIQRYRCALCLIDVPCQDTLDNHMRGKDHIKREKQLQEQRREKGDLAEEDSRLGYKVGPREMAKLQQTEREELEELRKTVKILRAKVQEQAREKAKCRKEHGTADMVDMRKKIKWCQETHLRPAEFSRPGIFTKREPQEQEAASTSRYKQEEYMEGGRAKTEHVERKGEYIEDAKDAKWS